MPLDDTEKMELEQIVKRCFHPMERKIQKMDQTLYGDNGLPGLCQISKKTADDLEEHEAEFSAFRLLFETRWAKVVGLVVAGQFIVGIAVTLAIKLL